MWDGQSASTLKAREDALWAQYASSGVLPNVPNLTTQGDINHAHALLSGQYNRLQQLLYGEALARKVALSDAEQVAHAESARWVWRTANSSKRGYANKNEMNISLAKFKTNSSNGYMALLAKLEKGGQKLKDSSKDDKVSLALKFCERLVKISSEQPRIMTTDEFIRLSISVGWELSRSDHTQKFKEMVGLLPDEYEVDNVYLRGNISKLKDKLRFAEDAPIREWFKTVKCIKDGGNGGDGQILEVLNKAVDFTAKGLHKTVRQGVANADSFDTRKMVLLKVTELVKGFKNRIPANCASAFLKILINDGLKDFSSSYFERKKKEVLPGQQLTAHAKTEWPSLAEDIAKMIVKAGKACFGHKRDSALGEIPDLEWAISFLEKVYAKFTDDEWADYRIGKMLVWSGDKERGKKRVLPVVRKKQTEYWAWELLGDLMPEKRKCCVARALACNADEQYTKAIKKEAAELGIDGLSDTDRNILLAEAEELLLEGLELHKGILIELFKNKDGKRRLVFSIGDGTNIRPISPKAANLQDIRLGMPVNLYWEREVAALPHPLLLAMKKKLPEVSLIAVKPRTDGSDWDVIKPKRAVFVGSFKEKSGSVAGIYADENGMEFVSRIKTEPFVRGDVVSVYFKDVVKDGRPRECLRIAADESGDMEEFCLLPQASVVYYGVSQKGTSYLFSSGQKEFNVEIDKFQRHEKPRPGDSFRVRYSIRKIEDKKLHKEKFLFNVQSVEPIDSVPEIIRQFSGRMRMPQGINGPGFVDDVYIPTCLFSPLLEESKDRLELFVEGLAVRLPSEMKIDRYGIQHKKSKYRVIELKKIVDPEIIERMTDINDNEVEGDAY